MAYRLLSTSSPSTASKPMWTIPGRLPAPLCDALEYVPCPLINGSRDRRAGRTVMFPIRYADDFVILVHGTRQQAEAERDALAEALRVGMGLTLSPDKTRITDPAEGFQFLGHRVCMRWDDRFGWSPRIEVPKHKAADLRYKVKQLTKRQHCTGRSITCSRSSTPSCVAGRSSTGIALAPKTFSMAWTGMSQTGCGAGCGRSIRKLPCDGCSNIGARAASALRGESGTAPRWSYIGWDG